MTMTDGDPFAMCISAFVVLALLAVAIGMAWLVYAFVTAPKGEETDEGFKRNW